MKPIPWPTEAAGIWAKSPSHGRGGVAESLAQHTWAVLERLRALASQRPMLPRMLKQPDLWHHLYWAAFLHDWGKAAAGFQDMLRGGERWPHRHEVLSLAFVDWLSPHLNGADDVWIAAAIVSHHRDLETIRDLYCPPEPGDPDQIADMVAEVDEADLTSLWQWLKSCGSAWAEQQDWIVVGVRPLRIPDCRKATEQFYSDGTKAIYSRLQRYYRLARRSGGVGQAEAAVALRGHLTMADHIASAHEVPSPPVLLEPDRLLDNLGLGRDKLYTHQDMASQITGHIMLTAPTGSGKTEAALLWAAYQMVSSATPAKLFYALPYQASMNAMKLRLGRLLGSENVGLNHGRALTALYRLIMEEDHALSPQSAAARARRQKGLSRLHAFSTRVLSPYQMLKAPYRLKGYEALLVDMSHGLFVFDEIHAYEPTRLAMILSTVRYLAQEWGGRFLFMSATFPTLLRDRLSSALGKVTNISAAPALYEAFRRHQIQMVDGEITDPSNLSQIEQMADSGSNVLVCCNLIARAQAVYTQLRERLQDTDCRVLLLHGGFNMRDRSSKEKMVRDCVGAAGDSTQSLVLIATQVVEVSLDIDLDTIFTEPAPLDALVQRFGRINRRRKQSQPAPVHVFRLPDDGQYIYRPKKIITNTLAILEDVNGQVVDESALGSWLDAVYDQDLAGQWAEEYDRAASEFEQCCLADLRPFQSADRVLRDLYYRAFDGVDVIPKVLEPEYESLTREDPLRAQELLLSISFGRLQQLRNASLTWEPAAGPIPIEIPYNSETGLDWSVMKR